MLIRKGKKEKKSETKGNLDTTTGIKYFSPKEWKASESMTKSLNKKKTLLQLFNKFWRKNFVGQKPENFQFQVPVI